MHKNTMVPIAKVFSSVVFVCILALPFIFHPYVVSGVSMEPTLFPGNVLLVSSLYLSPARGEIVVFHNPHDKKQTDIKRVVGLPNENVNLGQNSVTVTDPDGRSETFGSNTPLGRPNTEFFPMHLGPEDYMVLGDNRSQSTDSRSFGAVQPSDIIGIVVMKLY